MFIVYEFIGPENLVQNFKQSSGSTIRRRSDETTAFLLRM